MNKLDWNRERYRTRDLLLPYALIEGPPDPQYADVDMIYPWRNVLLNSVINAIYNVAHSSGYEGDLDSFRSNFGSLLEYQPLIYENYQDFPFVGDTQHLYFDLEEKILYYWDNKYIPVNILLIEDTILKGG